MQKPPEITFRDVEHSKELDEMIRNEIKKLEKVCDHMVSCKVTVEKEQKSQEVGNPYKVMVHVTVPPGHEIVSKNKHIKGEVYQPLMVSIRETFDNEQEQLRELVQRQQDEVKSHKNQEINGVVRKLFTESGYGFIENEHGEEIYFHQNSVLNNDFDKIRIGTGVSYFGEMGEKGPQARSVKIINQPGI